VPIKNNFTRKDLSKKIGLYMGYSVSISDKLVKEILNIIQTEVKINSVYLKNIGTFKIIKKKERIGRNPKSKKEFIITKRNSISFICSKNLLRKINDK
tara:strand:+ start:93 stop:386 length:294 start_codon:yes stop_codon:yes gene_type:complete